MRCLAGEFAFYDDHERRHDNAGLCCAVDIPDDADSHLGLIVGCSFNDLLLIVLSVNELGHLRFIADQIGSFLDLADELGGLRVQIDEIGKISRVGDTTGSYTFITELGFVSDFVVSRAKLTPRIDAQWCPLVVRIDRFEMENKWLLIVLVEMCSPIKK